MVGALLLTLRKCGPTRHNIGVKVKETYHLKRVDADYFVPSALMRMHEMMAASSQPRR